MRAFKTLIVVALWWLWVPIVLLIGWGLSNLITPGMGTWHITFHQWIHRWYGVQSGQFWLYFVVGILGTVAIVSVTDWGSAKKRWVIPGAALAIAALGFSMFQTWGAVWDNDKDAGRYYASATTFVVPDLQNPPDSVAKLFDRNGTGPNKACALNGPTGDDVHICITQGSLPIAGWEPRVASLDGASIVMTRTSGTKPGVNLNLSTLTYLNGDAKNPTAHWSAIRDGSGLSQPMDGVVEWTGGTANPTECSFGHGDNVNRAIAGSKGNSLPNLLNDKYPNLNFTMSDSWGYCDASNKPVIVFPVQKQIDVKNRTVKTAAGVVIMTGSASGDPAFTYQESVKAGQLPGPVYGASLVAQQRAANEWAGGRRIRDNQKFGFDPATSAVQEGNDSDYLLRSAVDGRLYWVTPLTPQGDSQLFVAYSVTPADQVNDGKLNQQKVYMLANNDPRVVNLDNLAAAAKDYVSQVQPGFISSGGKIVEFLPTGGSKPGDKGDEWQAYGELNGRVVYRLDITATNWIQPAWVSLEPNTNQPGQPTSVAPGAPAAGTSVCGKPLNGLTPSQLTNCIDQFSGELGQRIGK